MNLFVGNISRTVSDNALRALFAEFGEVVSVKILRDRTTGDPKGFGFVDMNNDSHALEAIRKLTNREFFGRKLVVSRARPKFDQY